MTGPISNQVIHSQIHTQGIADISHDETITDADAVRAIDAAVPVLRALKLKVTLFRAFILRYDDVLNVGFVDKDAPLGQMSGPNGVPAFEVRVDPKHFVPVGHNFMK